jgi:uncharacterized cupin superfamily protein
VSQLFSGSLLAASMLLGQSSEPPVYSGKSVVPPAPTMQQAQPAPSSQRPILGWFNREDRPVFSKIQGWWKKDQPETPAKYIPPPPSSRIRESEAPPPTTTAPPANDFPRKLPNPASQAPIKAEPIAKEAPVAAKEIQQTSLQIPAATTSTKSPILPNLVNKIGRDEKFEWITGQIEVENGNFVMYYATPETVDKYNGRIALVPQKADLSQFRRGDLVSVRGQLAQRPSSQGMVPIYRITHASLIERPKS